ncbi:MAG: hypothetical protein WDM78_21445 [Puia sp.]
MQQISGVISANTVLPILEDFLFEVEKNRLTIVATDHGNRDEGSTGCGVKRNRESLHPG